MVPPEMLWWVARRLLTLRMMTTSLMVEVRRRRAARVNPGPRRRRWARTRSCRKTGSDRGAPHAGLDGELQTRRREDMRRVGRRLLTAVAHLRRSRALRSKWCVRAMFAQCFECVFWLLARTLWSLLNLPEK